MHVQLCSDENPTVVTEMYDEKCRCRAILQRWFVNISVPLTTY
jgi:hypothetical protein